MKGYLATIEHRVAGIPCLIGVTDFTSVSGSYAYNAQSDLDYHGYTECDYRVLDRRGRVAPWLERKLDKSAQADIEELICDRLS